MKGYSGSWTAAVMSIVLVAIAIVALAAWWLMDKAFGADNVPSCLSKIEARAKFPNQVIYWHTVNRCWDNIPVKQYHAQANKAPRLPIADANNNRVQRRAAADAPVVSPPLPSIFYPDLMTGVGTTADMLQPGAMTTWPLLTDFDVPPPVFIPWQKRIGVLL